MDRKTRDIIKDVDKFYSVKKVHFSTSATEGVESNTANTIFDVSGIPQEFLTEMRTNLNTKLAPLEEKGIPGKIVARVIREQSASNLARIAVVAKVSTIFDFKSQVNLGIKS